MDTGGAPCKYHRIQNRELLLEKNCVQVRGSEGDRFRQRNTSNQTREFCEEMGIHMRFSSVEHPQTNGQAESANKVILRGLKRRLSEAKGAWLDEFPVVIWSYDTTPHSTTRETPFRMTYGADAMLPVEIDNSSWRTEPRLEGQNSSNMAIELDLLSETREEARVREAAM
ncbi:uncharacterized protein LOC130725074 [Lotus japonicus]|uniref:uncharacterized protein LOC130725074 n=1 Tax=Lotus japonicus TaxID=34305 RepID=UPI0025904A05|nr:uncharacterized protein LOC130725074 [Lotus japonicus]